MSKEKVGYLDHINIEELIELKNEFEVWSEIEIGKNIQQYESDVEATHPRHITFDPCSSDCHCPLHK